MTFLEHIFARIERDADAVLLREIRDGQFVSVTGAELLALVFAGAALPLEARA